MNVKFDELIDSFMGNKIGLCNQFLSAELSQLLQQNLLELDHDDRMFAAGIGNNLIKDGAQKKRSDKIFWLDRKNDNEHEHAFLDHIENFIEYLNRTCYTGINAYEFHYALYDTGSYYHRHKDQFQNNSDRKYSLISYLNDNWTDADGGALMIYQGNATDKILPNIRKAVFFESSVIEHEVLVANRPRMSITGWLKRS